MADPNAKPDFYKAFFDDATLSDLTIRLSDRAIQVHRIVLCRRSEYFTKLLTGRFKVCPLLWSLIYRYRVELIYITGDRIQRDRAQRRRLRLDGRTPSLHLRSSLR
jgi:hypothetical protein